MNTCNKFVNKNAAKQDKVKKTVRQYVPLVMMTSSNGNICRVASLCEGNSSVTGEFPSETDSELWYFLSSAPEQTADDLRRHRAHYDVTSCAICHSIRCVLLGFWRKLTPLQRRARGVKFHRQGCEVKVRHQRSRSKQNLSNSSFRPITPQFEFTDGYEMKHRRSNTGEVFQDHPSNFDVSRNK